MNEMNERHGPEEAEGLDETDETDAVEEKKEVNDLQSELWLRIDKVIGQCEVHQDKDVNGPLFMLAHEVRSMEEELKVRFSIALCAEAVQRWQQGNHPHLDENHDYLAEFLDKLSLVRFPKGRALLRAVESARGIQPPKRTERLCSDFQLLASLCRVLQYQADKKPFFLDGRSAAKALGRPHETVASWLRALSDRLRIIRRARYIYIAAD